MYEIMDDGGGGGSYGSKCAKDIENVGQVYIHCTPGVAAVGG